MRAVRATVAALSWLLALAVTTVLLVFNLRRLVFLVAAALHLAGERTRPADGRDPADELLPDVLALAPMRNESASLSGLAAALLALDYPADRLTIGLIDDASTDGSGAAIAALAAAHSQIHALHNSASLGKANSLNAGLRRWPAGEIVAVYDADARPEPGSLRQIAAAFADPTVAAAGGMIRPANGLASLTASYASIERLVHQQVTMRAKDWLDLTPAILGSNCAYRRTDLTAAGGFAGGAFLEDSLLTVEFARQGRRTRFLPAAVARDQVPATLGGYWRQHVRWGRGFVDVAADGRAGERRRRLKPAPGTGKPAEAGLEWTDGAGAKERRMKPAPGTGKPAEAGSEWTDGAGAKERRMNPAPDTGKPAEAGSEREWPWQVARQVELLLFSLGYVDRLALLAGVGLALVRGVSGRRGRMDSALVGMLAINVALPYAQIATALAAERAALAWWLRLPALPAFFIVDAAAAIWSVALSISRQPKTWQQTERA